VAIEGVKQKKISSCRSCTSSQSEDWSSEESPLSSTVSVLGTDCKYRGSTMLRVDEIAGWRQQSEEGSVCCLNDTGDFSSEKFQRSLNTVLPL